MFFVFIEILFKILLFKGGVLIYAEHCMLPGLISLDFCGDIQMVGSEFGVINMKAWTIPPCINGSCWCWWWNGVGDTFMVHFRPLGTKWAAFKHHRLPKCWWWFLSNELCHKAQIISNWVLDHENEFTVHKWSPQSPDLNSKGLRNISSTLLNICHKELRQVQLGTCSSTKYNGQLVYVSTLGLVLLTLKHTRKTVFQASGQMLSVIESWREKFSFYDSALVCNQNLHANSVILLIYFLSSEDPVTGGTPDSAVSQFEGAYREDVNVRVQLAVPKCQGCHTWLTYFTIALSTCMLTAVLQGHGLPSGSH